MAFLTPLTWETALDITGIFLCLIIIAFLIHNKIRNRRRVYHSRAECSGESLHTQVLARFIAQQSEKALDAVSIKVSEERRRLQEWAQESSRTGAMTIAPVDDEPGKESRPFQSTVEKTAPFGNALPGDPYAVIPVLRSSGMRVLEISNTVGRPVAEIELYLKVNKDRIGYPDKFHADIDTENMTFRQLFPNPR